MRRLVLVAALLVLSAGCVGPVVDFPIFGDGEDDGSSDDTPDVVIATPDSPDDDADDAPAEPRPDPEADELGWEAGYWYDDPLPVDNSDGLNDTEREAVIARAMARVERVRTLEFQQAVNVSVTSRENFSAGDLGGDPSEALRTFDNAKFEALFMVGSGTDSIATQESALNASIGGYYRSETEAIVIVSEGGGQPTLDSERTLAHELVHALQDQHFEALGEEARTRDQYNGRNGLIEGDANSVQYAYMDRCEDGRWRCVAAPDDGEGDDGRVPDLHLGIYLLEFFPYADGPGLVSFLRDGTDWAPVDDAYGRVPNSSTEVIYPERFGTFEPREVALEDALRDGWERVEPPDRPNSARLGQSALASMFAYTLFDDYNRGSVVNPNEFFNVEAGQVNRTDPYNYDLAPVRGWEGDRLHAYERDGEIAYVWRLAWDSPRAADRFADRYRQLLGHWGGERVGADTWRIADDSPFTGSVHVDVDGDEVTIAKAPTTGDLADVYPGAR